MPHLILETSKNLFPTDRLPDLFTELHRMMAGIADAKVETCKSRLLEYDHSHVGKGEAAGSNFAHLTIHLLDWRINEQLQALSEQALSVLKEHLAQPGKLIQLSVAINEMKRDYYRQAILK